MTMTGTIVLAYTYAGDVLGALASAAHLSPTTLGQLVRYLTRPPEPGTPRADVAAAYGLTIGQLRAGNTELAGAGYLVQLRRCVGQGAWQHLIIVTDTPGRLPGPHEAWLLLDASLAAENAVGGAAVDAPESRGSSHISTVGAHVATCGDADELQAATCAQKRPIEPVDAFPLDHPHAPAGPGPATVVATVADLERLAALPPLPAPKDQAHLWLTPAQVLTLIGRYPPRYGELALRVLARQHLPWYLAPAVVALLVAGYDTGQIGRHLAGVELAEHPAAVARWRLDQLLLADPPAHVAWVPPSTTVHERRPDPGEATARAIAAARAGLAATRARVRARTRLPGGPP